MGPYARLLQPPAALHPDDGAAKGCHQDAQEEIHVQRKRDILTQALPKHKLISHTAESK